MIDRHEIVCKIEGLSEYFTCVRYINDRSVTNGLHRICRCQTCCFFTRQTRVYGITAQNWRSSNHPGRS